jgi:hypothetical protein
MGVGIQDVHVPRDGAAGPDRDVLEAGHRRGVVDKRPVADLQASPVVHEHPGAAVDLHRAADRQRRAPAQVHRARGRGEVGEAEEQDRAVRDERPGPGPILSRVPRETTHQPPYRTRRYSVRTMATCRATRSTTLRSGRSLLSGSRRDGPCRTYIARPPDRIPLSSRRFGYRGRRDSSHAYTRTLEIAKHGARICQCCGLSTRFFPASAEKKETALFRTGAIPGTASCTARPRRTLKFG